MTAPTLEQVFGANATQTATTVTFSKADLAAVGLTASPTNSADSIFVALLLQSATYLNTTNQTSNTSINITIADSGYPSVVQLNSQNYRQITYNVNLQTLDTGFTVDPDNY